MPLLGIVQVVLRFEVGVAVQDCDMLEVDSLLVVLENARVVGPL